MYKFLIDTNIFLQAKHFHYRFDFCSHFWKWIEHAHAAGLVCSTAKVKDELMRGKDGDDVMVWATGLPRSFFIPDTSDKLVMKKYAEVMAWSAENTHFKPAAKIEFAKTDVADAFLIATAMAYGFEIITHELSNPEQKKKIQIPDAALQLGVKTHFVYDVLSEYSDLNFAFNPSTLI